MPRDSQSGSSEDVDQSDQAEEKGQQEVSPAQTLPPNLEALHVAQDHVKASSNFDVWPQEMLKWRDPVAFFKSSETLSLVVRSDRWLNRENFASCIHAVRTFVEASSTPEAIQYDQAHSTGGPSSPLSRSGAPSSRIRSPLHSIDQQPLASSGQSFATSTIQFLDLLHTLYTRVADIFYGPSPSTQSVSSKSVDTMSLYSGDKLPMSSGYLWQMAFCPLLQVCVCVCECVCVCV